MSEYRKITNTDSILLHLEYENEIISGNGNIIINLRSFANDPRDKEVNCYLKIKIEFN